MFVDGENVLFRFEEMLKQRQSHQSNLHSPSRYIWNERLEGIHQIPPYRVLYYTAAQGDDEGLEALRWELAQIRISIPGKSGKREDGTVTPMVFKKAKNSAKTKSVDINLTTDLLRATYNRSVDRVIVLSGDGDYLPVYEEAMRNGVRVTVGALSSGLNRQIRSRVDHFLDLDHIFFQP